MDLSDSIPRVENGISLRTSKVPVKIVHKAFYLFMQKRFSELKAQGFKFENGWQDVAKLLHPEWKALSEYQQHSYFVLAKKLSPTTVHVPISESHHNHKEVKLVTLPLEERFAALRHAKEEKERREAKMKLDMWELIDSTHPAKITMVIINFSTYVNILEKMFLPAEIGLTAFSMEKGIVGNYWSLIDPYKIPLELGLKTLRGANKLGLPFPPCSNHFQNYFRIIENIKNFLEKHANPGAEKALVFCLEGEMVQNEGCLDWLYDQIGKKNDVELHSFGEIVKQLYLLGRSVQDKSRCLTQMPDKSLQPPSFPSTSEVPYFFDKYVQQFSEPIDGTYESELCCLHHMRPNVDGIQHCALNVTNRYAYYALSFLVSNYNVEAKASYHYVDRSQLPLEAERRIALLREWGYDKESFACLFDYDDNLPPSHFSYKIIENVLSQNFDMENLPVCCTTIFTL